MKNKATPIGYYYKGKGHERLINEETQLLKEQITSLIIKEMTRMPFLIQCTRLTAISTFSIF